MADEVWTNNAKGSDPLTLADLEAACLALKREFPDLVDHYLAHPADVDLVRGFVRRAAAQVAREMESSPVLAGAPLPKVRGSAFVSRGFVLPVTRDGRHLLPIKLPVEEEGEG